MPRDYDEAARKWDRDVVPPELDDQSQINKWLNDTYGDNENVPQGFIDEIGPRVADVREREEEAGIQGGEIFFDPTAGRFRDGDTGQFISGGGDGN